MVYRRADQKGERGETREGGAALKDSATLSLGHSLFPTSSLPLVKIFVKFTLHERKCFLPLGSEKKPRSWVFPPAQPNRGTKRFLRARDQMALAMERATGPALRMEGEKEGEGMSWA